MGYYCTVPQCTSLAGKTKNVKFHRFPRDEVMASKWNQILKRGKPYTQYSKVCSLHFTQADYNVTTMGQWKTLSKDAIPTQNLPKLNPDGTVMVIRKSRTVKYREREIKKEDLSDVIKTEKWVNLPQTPLSTDSQEQEHNMAYRLQAINTLANAISPQNLTPIIKPEKQDAIMQTDPQSEDESQHNSYSESEKSTQDVDYQKYDTPKNFSKDFSKDFIPTTNEEYNKEAEKYALERKVHYEKVDYPKQIENGYKIQEYTDFTNREYGYYQDSVEILRNQQHNLQILQETHRLNENQNFFNENHIKQEIDFGNEEDKFIYEPKERMDPSPMYENPRSMEQPRLMEMPHQVKQEPDTSSNGRESVMQPQGSPYYSTSTTSSVTGNYYDQIRPGPELLIAKQNALAAHQQLWPNSMKRPFFYSESPHYNTQQILHRYEDFNRILQ